MGRPLTSSDTALVRSLTQQDRPGHPSSWLRARAQAFESASSSVDHLIVDGIDAVGGGVCSGNGELKEFRDSEACDVNAAVVGQWGANLWGWKEPNSHVILERLMRRFPDMKYIHVMRRCYSPCYRPPSLPLAL